MKRKYVITEQQTSKSYRADIPFSIEEKKLFTDFIKENGLVARKWLRAAVLKAIRDQRSINPEREISNG